RARRLDKTYLPSSPPGCSASLCVLITISYSLLSDYDFDAASIVSETANARHFLRARGLAGHGLHDAGNDAALELTQSSSYRLHARAGHALIDIHVDLRWRHDRDFDD